MLHRIISVTPLTNYRLRLVYTDGLVTTVDFNPLIAQGGVFSALSDPEFFAQVSLGERGRSIEWASGLDFCADALRLDTCFEQQVEAVAS